MGEYNIGKNWMDNTMVEITREQFVKYGGLTPVNGGKLFQEGDDTLIEVLGPSYSGHPTNMIVLYAREGELKVSLVYDGSDRYYVYRFKTWDSLQHYRSYALEVAKVGKKYERLLKYAVIEYQKVFNR